MASTIVTKNSSTASAVPLTGDLTQGELAVNVTDKRLFTKNSGGTVVELGTNPASLALPNGTANGVAYLNGSKVVTTGSALTFGGSNLRVGSGTVSAVGADGAASYLVRDWDAIGANGTVLTFGGITASQWTAAAFYASGSEQMRLTTTGLGIGTSSPGRPLDVIRGTAGFVSKMGYSSGVSIYQYTDANAAYISTATNLYNAFGINETSSYLNFYTANAERMRIDSSGNLGIGTTSPGAKLEVTGNILQTWATSHNRFIGTQFSTTYENGLRFLEATRETQIIAKAADTGGLVTFFTGTAPTERMRLDSSGNLGLGRPTNANYRFIIRGLGTTSATAGLVVENSSGTEYFYLNDAGNLGLGTSSPGSKLQVQGLIRTSSSAAGIQIDRRDTSASAYTLYSSAGNLQFYNGTSDVMTLDASGNLLVGTTNTSATAGVGFKAQVSTTVPQFAIVVNEAGTSTNLSVYNTNASAYRFYVNNGGTIFATSTTISAISDQRFKENVRDLDVGLDAVMALKPRLYDWKEGKGANIKNARGFIAQEFEQVFPDLIDEWKDPAPEGEEPYKSVRQDLIPVLVKAIQEQQALIQQLQADVAALKGN